MTELLKDGYPTKKTLKLIREYPVHNLSDYHNLMEIVDECVEQYGLLSRANDTYVLYTCGWAGNEEVVNALMSNQLFWLQYWHLSRRGGRFVFKPSDEIQPLQGA